MRLHPPAGDSILGATPLATALADRYRLERELGAGGMATVYLAHDLRHGRNVAIKVLRPELVARLGSERFVQEIKVTANLQHPNILSLYDSGRVIVAPVRSGAHNEARDGEELLYYVMPYVEGETLRGKIDRERQLTVEATVAIARAVAAALDYAHAHGVVHRDIKPENILLQHGQALVADFGIALAVEAAGGARLTETGLSIGTPYYMSPEQAMGDRALDARTDIYALGAVTYEMLTGDPPHRASTPHAIVAKILSEPPSPIARSREMVPANVDAAVRRALAKSPADRFARAADFGDALTNPAFRLPDSGETRAITAPGLATERRGVWVAAAVATAVVGLVGGWALHRAAASRGAPVAARPAVFLLPLDSGSVVPGYPALSPDGTTLVYPAGDAGANRLYVRPLDTPVPSPVPRTEGAQFPFFSPDGEWVAFLADQTLRKVRLRDGNDAVIVPFIDGLAGATWREDDTILLALLPKGALFSVSATGGTLAPFVIGAQRFDSGYFFPHFLPHGNAIVYNTESTGGQLGVLDLRSGARHTLGRGLRPSYLETGHLIFANVEGRLAVQRFDASRLDTVGGRSVLSEQLAVGLGRAFYSTSRAGTLAIIRSAGTDLDLVLFDGANRRQVLMSNAGAWVPRFSPDGNLIAVGGHNPNDVWIYDLRTRSHRRFTTDGGGNNDPTWSPDGRELAFSADRPSRKDVLVRAVDGSGERRVVVREGLQWPSAWTRDGYIVFTDVSLDEDRDIWIAKADGSAPPVPYLATPSVEKAADVSSDGRWIAYESNAPGQFEVFVDRFPQASGAPAIISDAGGRHPRWGRDGRTLYYWHERRLIAVRLELGARPRALGSRTVLEASYTPGEHANYDVHPDGKRIVVVEGRGRPQRLILALDPLAGATRAR